MLVNLFKEQLCLQDIQIAGWTDGQIWFGFDLDDI